MRVSILSVASQVVGVSGVDLEGVEMFLSYNEKKDK